MPGVKTSYERNTVSVIWIYRPLAMLEHGRLRLRPRLENRLHQGASSIGVGVRIEIGMRSGLDAWRRFLRRSEACRDDLSISCMSPRLLHRGRSLLIMSTLAAGFTAPVIVRRVVQNGLPHLSVQVFLQNHVTKASYC